MAESQDVLVASDSWGLNALMVANGVPLLNGYQVTGPVKEEWAKIDPDGDYEFEWNRGASYIWMDFARPRGQDPVISNPSNDVILVSVDPCWLAGSGLDVGYVVSSTPDLAPECLEPMPMRLPWSDVKHFLYRVEGVAPAPE